MLSGSGRVRHRRADSESTLPVTILTDARAHARVLASIARGDDRFIISSLNGAIVLRARLARIATVDIQYGSLSIDWCSGTVTSATGRLTLSRTELRLLGALLAHREKPVAHAKLLECTWPGVESDGPPGAVRLYQLQTYMYSLRHRLALLGARERLETVSGTAYVLRI